MGYYSVEGDTGSYLKFIAAVIAVSVIIFVVANDIPPETIILTVILVILCFSLLFAFIILHKPLVSITDKGIIYKPGRRHEVPAPNTIWPGLFNSRNKHRQRSAEGFFITFGNIKSIVVIKDMESWGKEWEKADSELAHRARHFAVQGPDIVAITAKDITIEERSGQSTLMQEKHTDFTIFISIKRKEAFIKEALKHTT